MNSPQRASTIRCRNRWRRGSGPAPPRLELAPWRAPLLRERQHATAVVRWRGIAFERLADRLLERRQLERLSQDHEAGLCRLHHVAVAAAEEHRNVRVTL